MDMTWDATVLREQVKDIEKQKHVDSGFILWGDGGSTKDELHLEDAGSLDSISTDFNSVSL